MGVLCTTSRFCRGGRTPEPLLQSSTYPCRWPVRSSLHLFLWLRHTIRQAPWRVLRISRAWISRSVACPLMTPEIIGWWIINRALGVAKRLFGSAHRLKTDPIDAASPVTSVVTGEVIIFIWSQMAKPESTEPPGLLMIIRIGLPGAISSRYSRLTDHWYVLSLSIASWMKIRLASRRVASILIVELTKDSLLIFSAFDVS